MWNAASKQMRVKTGNNQVDRSNRIIKVIDVWWKGCGVVNVMLCQVWQMLDTAASTFAPQIFSWCHLSDKSWNSHY